MAGSIDGARTDRRNRGYTPFIAALMLLALAIPLGPWLYDYFTIWRFKRDLRGHGKLVANHVIIGGTDKDALPAIEILQKHPTKMPTLSVYGSRGGISDRTLEEIAKLRWLTTLRFHRCDHITDAGLSHLCALDQLATLELDCEQITDAGLLKLGCLKSLRSLGASGPSVTPGGFETLSKVLPDLIRIAESNCA